MRAYRLSAWGLEHLRLVDVPEPDPPGPGEALLEPRALSLNYRDLLVVRGVYNPRFQLPATPISDAAGVVRAVGAGVQNVGVGDAVVAQFVAGWKSGPFRGNYVGTTLGFPGPGMAAERVTLRADALLPLPRGYDFSQAATLPIAAVTAWSALVTEGGLDPSRTDNAATVLTLGTGGVSIFALQFAKALGARVVITSSSDEKLARAKALGADWGVNYRKEPEWDRAVLAMTGGEGADITVEIGGAGTLDRSLKATRAGGRIGMLGALTGTKAEVTVGMILMKRLRIAGIMVDSQDAFQAMNAFIERHAIRPVIDQTFSFECLPEALRLMESGGHFGKIVISV
jgi:NADPH:quinone reductase-like Zn-dependent oxidoreductase